MHAFLGVRHVLQLGQGFSRVPGLRAEDPIARLGVGLLLGKPLALHLP